MVKNIPRLYYPGDLKEAVTIDLAGQQAHYLLNVMRRKANDPVLLFNGHDGEWLAHIADTTRKYCKLIPMTKTRNQTNSADIWLLFAPIKHGRIDYLTEKATELGVSRICPVITDHTQVSNIKIDRLQAHAIEAAEQSECLDVPEVREPTKLNALLQGWNSERIIFMGAERHNSVSITQACQKTPSPSAAILIGPEGGFSEKEFALLESLPFVLPVSLGSRILRSDTAALAMLSCWQSLCGDW
jgi:16S rRNA (uracil1498-N3)-methyltransferase